MSQVASPVESLSLDALLDELVSGRPVALGEERQFTLPSPEARSVLTWYRANREKWGKNVLAADVDAIVARVDQAPPALTPRQAVPARGRRTLRLRTLRAHRFGGIHDFGTPDQTPRDFVHTFDRPLTLIEGVNGAGKTSVLRAILWCLTGHVYRPLRPPEPAKHAIEVAPDAQAFPEAEEAPSWGVSAVTPMPSAEVLSALGDDPVPLDTWVELTFVDDQGKTVGPVRRSVHRGPRGAVSTSEPTLAALGIDPLSCDVATRMPAQLPYLELGSQSDLGRAVADLLGVKPLQMLSQHARRVQAKLTKDRPRECQAEIDLIDTAYNQTRSALNELLARHPDLGRDSRIPNPDRDGSDLALAAWLAHFERHQGEALNTAHSILGGAFDPAAPVAREDLIANVGPALGLLDASHLARLPSAVRLGALARLGDDDLGRAETLLAELQEESRLLAEQSDQPAWATRLRLYARVAGWMRESETHDIDDCPLCRRPLEGQVDEVSGRPVQGHLRDHLHDETALLEKLPRTWAQDALTRLRAGVGPTLRAELNLDLPARPADLMTTALSDELFASPHLHGCLGALKGAAQALCDRATAALPEFVEPPVPAFRGSFSTADLEQVSRRLARAVAFARWRRSHDAACKQAFAHIVGRAGSADAGQPEHDRPLLQRLTALDRLVKMAEPVSTAIAHARALIDLLERRKKVMDRLLRFTRTALALDALLGLPDLVERQVTSLTRSLADATARWKERLYAAAYEGAPWASRPEIGPDGSITLAAASAGVQAPAQHVGNTAELRAALLAFFLAFWEHLLRARGGLALLLLDDPQELFDRANRRRLAHVLPALASGGAGVIVTTLDADFANEVADAAGEQLPPGHLARLRIEPRTPGRPMTLVGE